MKKYFIAAVAGILAVSLAACGADDTKSDRTEKNSKKHTYTSERESESKSDYLGIELTFHDETDTVTEHESDAPETEKHTESVEVPTKPEETSDSGYKYAYAGFEPAYADMNVSDWRLILVNRDYILPDGYKPELANAVESGFDDMYLDERVAPYYNEMYKAAYEDGIHLVPISGYRSVERQTRNFERKINYYIDRGYSKVEATQEAATIILPPGTSEHNAGLAMDICSLEQNFEDTKEFEWLCENAADYGFILRYPEDKQDITKIIYEPWHWRYVGVEAAKEMKASGECLEEYLGLA